MNVLAFEPLRMTRGMDSEGSALFDSELECFFHVANTPGLLREADRLVRHVHNRKGFLPPKDESCGPGGDVYDLLPTTVRFLAEHHGQFVATLRTVTDSKLGLPMDTIFPDKLAALRRQGRVPCEIASMVVDEEHDDASRLLMLFGLFRLAYLSAVRLDGATDMVASVMVHHQAFYRRILLFDEVDRGSKTSPKTGREVCFVRLNLDTAVQRYREYYERRAGGRNLHSFFVNGREEQTIRWLNAQRGRSGGAAVGPGWVETDETLRDVIAQAG